MIKILNHELCKNVNIEINGQNGICNTKARLNNEMKSIRTCSLIVKMSSLLNINELKVQTPKNVKPIGTKEYLYK